MLFVDNEKITDPRINLAIEEYLLRHAPVEADILLFYINEPSIIIGRNQNTLEEINPEYVEAHQIKVVRRLSGGGAVYHDLGNLNYSFITRGGRLPVHDFKKFTAPVVKALIEMGVPAELSGRNDITAAGRKISGTASYSTKQGTVSHGTLLFDTDLTCLVDALKVKPGKIASKGIQSVRSRVANIAEFLPGSADIEAFRLQILSNLIGSGDIQQYRLTPADWEGIHLLASQRYLTWEWNYGQSPEFNVQKTHRFPCGEIDARINVKRGMIESIRFYGDYIGSCEVSELETLLRGVRYDPTDIAQALQGTDPAVFFGGLSREELIEFLY